MDIFDEIIQCLQNEKDQYGNVFINRDHLTEFFANVAVRTASAGAARASSGTPAIRTSVSCLSGNRRESSAASSVPPSAAMPGHQEPAASPERRHPAVSNTESQAVSSQRPGPPSPEEVASMDWNQLRQATFRCHGCRLCETRTNVVFADGNEHAELMFIGEGPGADEDAQGVPFVGKAGQLLTKMIAAMQFKREEVYIANIVKCRPPGNRNPTDDEMASCLPYLLRQIELVRPKVIVLLGSVALKGLLNRSGIMRMRGHWLDYRGIMVMPTFHPAYLLRYEAGKKDAWSDLQQVMKVFGKVYRKPH